MSLRVFSRVIFGKGREVIDVSSELLRAFHLPLILFTFFFGQLKGFAGEKPAGKRCLSNYDCPAGQPCINRRCFSGLLVNIGSYKIGAYRLAVANPLVFSKEQKLIRIAEQIRRQIMDNFRRLRGTFAVLSPKSFLEKPPFNGIELGTFKFKAWSSIGANGLIKFALFPAKSGDKFRIAFRFYDVDSGKLALRIDRELNFNFDRWDIHYLCDMVYSYLTGSKGIFRTKIAYVQRNPRGGKDIWLIDFDGRRRQRLISNGSLNLFPTWSPDGRYLAFVSFLKGRPHLYRIELSTGRIKQLTFGSGTYAGPAYSPDGKWLAFSMTPANGDTDSDIYLIPADGGKMLRLTHTWGIDVSPSWSPDGKWIAFVSERYASPQIFVMRADGSEQTRLTFRGDYNQEPRWSPTRNEILFTARDEFFQYDLFVIDLNPDQKTGKFKPTYRRLTQNQGSNLEAVWSPDGRYILFVSTRIGERKLFLMNADGSSQHLFLRGRGDFESPAWSPVLKSPYLKSASPRVYVLRTSKGIASTKSAAHLRVKGKRGEMVKKSSAEKSGSSSQPSEVGKGRKASNWSSRKKVSAGASSAPSSKSEK